jgi:hypothetical protein
LDFVRAEVGSFGEDEEPHGIQLSGLVSLTGHD